MFQNWTLDGLKLLIVIFIIIINLNSMNFVEEFIDQQFAKNIGSAITEQLQICHSAAQDLLVTLESLRMNPKHELIHSKITQISIFLQTKQQILQLLQNEQEQSISFCLLNDKIQSPLLIEIIKKQQSYVDDMIIKMIKNVFLGDETLEDYCQQNQIIGNCISILTSVKDDLNCNKVPNRQKLKSFDCIQPLIWDKMSLFNHKIVVFNRQIATILQKLYEFERSISGQFKGFFNSTMNNNIKSQASKINFQRQQNNYQQFYEENYTQPIGKNAQYSKTFAGGFKLSGQKTNNFNRSELSEGWKNVNKSSLKNDISQLGLNSQINIKPQISSNSFWKTSKSSLSQPKPSYPIR